MLERKFIKFSAIFTLIISGITILISIFSILAHFCHLESWMERQPVAFMTYLLYFRSYKCYPYIYWWNLGFYSPTQPQWPAENLATLRTFVLTLLYLLFSILSIITSVSLLYSLRPAVRSRFKTYMSFILPFLVMNFLVFILDIVAMSLYSGDLIQHSTPLGLMASLEIRNPEDFILHFYNLAVHVRVLPSLIMLAFSSKIVIIFMANIAIFIGVAIAGWKLGESNKRLGDLQRADLERIINNNNKGPNLYPTLPRVNINQSAGTSEASNHL